MSVGVAQGPLVLAVRIAEQLTPADGVACAGVGRGGFAVEAGGQGVSLAIRIPLLGGDLLFTNARFEPARLLLALATLGERPPTTVVKLECVGYRRLVLLDGQWASLMHGSRGKSPRMYVVPRTKVVLTEQTTPAALASFALPDFGADNARMPGFALALFKALGEAPIQQLCIRHFPGQAIVVEGEENGIGILAIVSTRPVANAVPRTLPARDAPDSKLKQAAP